MSSSVANGAAYAAASSAPAAPAYGGGARVISERTSTYAVGSPQGMPAAATYSYAAAPQQAPVVMSAGAAPAVSYPAQVYSVATGSGAAYSAPTVSYGAATVGYGAPQVSYPSAQPNVVPAGVYTSGGGSYVPPVMSCQMSPYPVQPGHAIAAPMAPVQPQSLTQGMPDPESIESQKAAYNRSLEEQAKHGEDMLKAQKQQQTDYIYQAAEAQKKQLISQIDQQAKQQELQLSQKYSQQVMSLQQEFQHQKLVLEKQANDLAMEFQRRKSQEDMMTQQYEMQRAHYEDQMRMMAELQSQPGQDPAMPPQAAMPGGMQMGGSYVPPPAMAVPSPMPQQSLSYVPPTMMPGAPSGGSYVPPPVAYAAPVTVAQPPVTVAQPPYPPAATTQAVGSYGAMPQTAYSAPTTSYTAGTGMAAQNGVYAAEPQAQYSAPPPMTPTGQDRYVAPVTQYGGAIPATNYGGGSMGVQPATSSYTTGQPSPYSIAPTAPNVYAAAGGQYEAPPTAMVQPQY
mmetsp:Transcript_80637/g.179120  ORF Transcript_80637/g.179120 Transcript_80637/m.179120 type:complete len:510 (-) Transcript_80637:168-1697(-)